MRRILTASIVGLALFSVNAAFAHGDGGNPRHGGVVQNASDLSFELVATADGATIYVEDHGKPMATAGMSGKLMVLAGTNKTEVAMATVGDKFEAKGVKLAKGVKVVASLMTSAKKPIVVRFTVK